ncbi:hypothetical protein ACLOJK_002864 [Asimina triloba]
MVVANDEDEDADADVGIPFKKDTSPPPNAALELSNSTPSTSLQHKDGNASLLRMMFMEIYIKMFKFEDGKIYTTLAVSWRGCFCDTNLHH